MRWYKISQNESKTHPDPWTLTFEELQALELPKFEAPAGFLLGYHVTSMANVDSILANGLLMGKAKGRSYGEPNWIWAYSEEVLAREKHISYIIFQVPKGAEVDQPNEVTIRVDRDVSPAEILYAVKGYQFEQDSLSFERYVDEFKGENMKASYNLMIKWAKERGLPTPEEPQVPKENEEEG